MKMNPLCPMCRVSHLEVTEDSKWMDCKNPNCNHTFTLWELEFAFGYDFGDLYNFDTVSETLYEPLWVTKQERKDAYEMVTRMFMGVSELDDKVDCGYPVGQVGV